MAAPKLIDAIAALGGLARADEGMQQGAQWRLLQSFLLDLERQQKALQVAPDVVLSFDDQHIGWTDSSKRSMKYRTSISNPFQTNGAWYAYAGKILALVKDEVARALTPLHAIRSAYAETFGEMLGDSDAQIIETIRDIGGVSDLVRELDVALNGEAGAAQLPSLCDLVAQVARERSAVRIVNFTDGMRLNFRAGGKSFTWNISEALNGQDDEGAQVLRAAIAAYPRVEPLPVVVDDFQGELQGAEPSVEELRGKPPLASQCGQSITGRHNPQFGRCVNCGVKA